MLFFYLFLSPPDKKRQKKCESIVQIHIWFVIDICCFECPHKKEIITNNCNTCPDTCKKQVIQKCIDFYFLKKYPQRNNNANWHDKPPNKICREYGKKHYPKAIANKPHKETPQECFFDELLGHIINIHLLGKKEVIESTEA